MSVNVNSSNFDTEVLGANEVVLADFYSDTCGPCRRMMPVLAELDDDYGSRMKLAKINVNSDAELAGRYNVQAVPTFIFFKNGKETSRIIGAVNKTEISSIIEDMTE